jgi:hypothetical protein
MTSPKHRLPLPTRRARLQSPASGALSERIASKMPAVLADGVDNDVVG